MATAFHFRAVASDGKVRTGVLSAETDKSVAQELRRQGVTVSALCPGPTATGFVDRAGLDNADLFKRVPPMASMQVAEAGVAGLMAGRRVILPGLRNKLTGRLAPLLPHALVLPVIAYLQAVRRHD